MTRLWLLIGRIAALIGARRVDRELVDEIAAHVDEATDEYIRAGFDPARARREALRQFGGVASTIERHRRARTFAWIEDWGQDFRFAARMLRRSPGFTAAAVLSLALGIGVNTAIFTLMNAVMFQKLPVTEPERLVRITRLLDNRPGVVSYPLFQHLSGHMTSIAGAFAQQVSNNQSIVIDGERETAAIDFVSGEYFGLLGVTPALGRLLSPADDLESPESLVAVASHRYWTRRFGQAPSTVGRTFSIGNQVFTIVGVTPPEFSSATAGLVPDLTVPLMSKVTTGPQYRNAQFNWLNVLARLRPGATIDQAAAEVEVLFDQFVQAQSATLSAREREATLRQRAVTLPAPGGFNPFRDSVERPLLILLGLVLLILLLACLNLSGLLMARTSARQREIAVRLALGVGRGRLFRQFFTETAALVGLGAGLGLVLAGWLSATLFRLFANGRDLVVSLSPDWRVLLFTTGICALACALVGVAPAMHAGRLKVHPTLQDSRYERRHRAGMWLATAQIAVSMMLLVGAGLLVGTFTNLATVERGVRTDGVLAMSVGVEQPMAGARAEATRALLLERLRRLPGVDSAGAGLVLPLGGVMLDRSVTVEGHTLQQDELRTVGFNIVSPSFFSTLRTPFVSGRDFDDRDRADAPLVAVINQRFQRDFFGSDSALGRRIMMADETYEIVAVVADAKYRSLRDEAIRTVYVSWMQLPRGPQRQDQPSNFNYVIRVPGADVAVLSPALRALVRELDAGLYVRTVVRYDSVIGATIATERILAALGGLFGILALVVAGLGVFGLVAFQVARRTSEFGVRLALGATRRSVEFLVLRSMIAMIMAGILLGVGGAVMLTDLADGLLYGLTPTDPRVFGMAALTLALATVTAGWLPARRASRVDPVVALRRE